MESSGGFLSAIDSAFGAVALALKSALFFNCNFLTTNPKLPFIVIWLIIACVFFTVRFKFINFRYFGYALAVFKGRYNNENKAAGEISSNQALFTALAGSIGLGNIAGVAAAVSLGGPGAVFWMIVAGFLSMTMRFVEATLGHKYRERSHDGYVGGPFYYMSRGIEEYYGYKTFGKVLAVVFAVMFVVSSFGGPGAFQTNQAVKTITDSIPSLANYTWAISLVFAIGVGAIIMGGLKRIAGLASKLVPIMASIYLVCCLIIIFCNYTKIPHAVATIFSEAFQIDSIYGGIFGSLIMGFQRAIYANESGMGSAPIVHSDSTNKEPAREGLVSMIGPIFDILFVCMFTGIIVTLTDTYKSDRAGILLTIDAFKTVHEYFPYVLTLIIPIFAFSVATAWSYYGLKAWNYLFGEKTSKLYQLLFCFMLFVGGVVKDFGDILNFCDAVNLATALPNILVLYMLTKYTVDQLKIYESKYLVKYFNEKKQKAAKQK